VILKRRGTAALQDASRGSGIEPSWRGSAAFSTDRQKTGFTKHRSKGNLPIMPETKMSWPHCPKHQLAEQGAYFVTCSTYENLKRVDTLNVADEFDSNWDW